MGAAAVLTKSQEEELLRLGLKDSKKISAPKREALFARMRELNVVWRAHAANLAKIEELNIAGASLWAMGQSVRKLPLSVDVVVVDGPYRLPGLSIRQAPLVSADSLVPAVSAASVIAKVLRDRVMTALDRLYPLYGFARHKGYPTEAHRKALYAYGLSPVHRPSFCHFKTGKIELTAAAKEDAGPD
jgi:ribonuclease HII